MNRAVEGQVIFVRAGLYLDEKVAFPRSGTPDKPIQIIGYSRTPGDGPSVRGDAGPKPLDASSLPLLDGGNRAVGIGVDLSNRSHLIVRNLQITNYMIGVYGWKTNHSVVDNVFTARLGDVQADYSGVGIKMDTGSDYNQIINSVVENAAAEGIMVYGNHNKIAGCRVYASDNSTGWRSSTDYYILTGGSYNTIQSNIVHRLGALGHTGHGIGAKGNTQFNVFEDNLAVNFDGTAYYVRHRGSMNNTFRRNRALQGDGMGFAARDGASQNLVEDHQVEDMWYGVAFFDTTEDGGLQAGGNFNRVVRATLRNTRGAAISYHGYTYKETSSTGNYFGQLKVDGAGFLFEVDHRAIKNEIVDAEIRGVQNYAIFRSGKTATDLDVSFDRTVFENNGFGTP